MEAEHKGGVVDTRPAIGITSHHALGPDGRALVFQSFVPLDCEPAELDAVLDKLAAAGARQEAALRLPMLVKRLALLRKQQQRATEDMFRLDAEAQMAEESRVKLAAASGRRVERPDSAQDIQRKQKVAADRANAETTYKRHAEDIDDLKVEIAELEALIAKGG